MMDDVTRHRPEFAKLRRRAEALARRRPSDERDLSALGADEIRQLVHELDVQRIELEMQNDELRESQAALEAAKDRFSTLFDLAPVGYFSLDAKGRIRQVNRTGGELLGALGQQLVERRLQEFIASKDQDGFFTCLRLAFKAPVRESRELEMVRADGSTFFAHLEAFSQSDERGNVIECLTVILDISMRKRAEQHIREAALHDGLTGLPNRVLIFEFGRHQLAAAQRSQGGGALLFVDLDRFKQINDQYGHETGDLVLEEVARRLTNCTRQADLVGRLGGDEFVILLPHMQSERHRAATVAQHVIESIGRPIQLANQQLCVTASVGISCYPEQGSDMDALIRAADLAMYQSKHSGRAIFHFYSPELEQHAAEALALEARLKTALKLDEFSLLYQPVIDIRSGRLVAAEALLRLCDDNGTAIAPQRFIAVAESAGLIDALGEWVTVATCRQQQQWSAQGLPKIPVAINVSPLQFRQGDFVERFYNILQEGGIDASYLQLEVTESAFIERVDEVIDTFQRIKRLGVRIALDDFGIGYSSLNLLTKLPLDKLKIDRSFVQGIEHDATSLAVTKAIIALGRALELDVVAEGIETQAAFGSLLDCGCDQAQGYLISRPLPADQFVSWYRAKAA